MDGIFWILGCPDAEMSAIESLLRQCGQRVYVALAPTMRLDPVTGTMRPVLDEQGLPVYGRVAPGQVATGAAELLADGTEGAVLRHTGNIPDLVAVEVAGPWGQAHIDHHGHAERAEWGPDRFLQASSLGQVISRLAIMGALPESWHEDVIGAYSPAGQIDSDGQGYLVWGGLTGAHADGGGLGEFDIERIWRIPQALVFEAAADHCLAAAFAGACPGIDPVEGGNFWRTIVASRRAIFAPDMSEEEYTAALALAQLTLCTGPPALDLDPIPEDVEEGTAYPSRESLVRDLTHLDPFGRPAAGTGERYPDAFQFGPLVGAITGLGYLVRVVNRDGNIGMRLGGCGLRTRPGPKPVQRWLDGVGEARGCYPLDAPRPKNLYGSSARGFGGGTLREG